MTSQALFLYNSLSRKKELFQPLKPPFVGMYVCGPTVYGDAHLGHARPAVTFDLVFRYLSHLGYKVRYVRNITDVGHLEADADEGEDKIAKKARLEQLEPMEVAQYFTDRYHQDMDRMGVKRPSIEPRASGHIIEQIELTRRILQAGFAYVVNGSVYFDVEKFHREYGYGRLSGRVLDDMMSGSRILEAQQEKRAAVDFALWKKADPAHLMRWPSPWGEGFPGWHAECSAMSTKYLGEVFDIHGGGMDLLFPHHECEMAQSKAASGQDAVRYWLHNNMITINGQKMGKSLGNFISLREFFSGSHKSLTQAFDPMTIRFFILQAHYRSTLDFSNEALLASEKGLKRLLQARQSLKELKASAVSSLDVSGIAPACYQAMNDDFNSPLALAQLFDAVRIINAVKDGYEKLNAHDIGQLSDLFSLFLDEIFGLGESQTGQGKGMQTVVNGLMEMLLDIRQQARANKDWATSDKIRDSLMKLNIEVKDGKDKVSWDMNPGWEFHIAKSIRQEYQISESLFSTNGQIVFSDFLAVRQLSYRLNEKREPSRHIYPGELYAAGLLDEIFHLIIRAYEKKHGLECFQLATEQWPEKINDVRPDSVLMDFTRVFPPDTVYQGVSDEAAWLKASSGGRQHKAMAMEEALMLSLDFANPANRKISQFFDPFLLDDPLAYFRLIEWTEIFFTRMPAFGPDQTDLITMLKTPMLIAPDDLSAQLEYVLSHWGEYLPESVKLQLLRGRDLMKEDVRLAAGQAEAVSPPVPRYDTEADSWTFGRSGFDYASAAAYPEHARYTPDTHWMPRVVLMAKNTWVWLDQLSKKYQRPVRRLDQIPDEELDQLARWQFNGLWLIGIWERSQASQRIKHLTGNADAVSSAYSLFDYEIAADLGGEQAYQNLNERAKARGIRLASDMVPNHTGLYSRWVVDHPDYFIQTDQPPFPAYRFTGENLSPDPNIEIRIEDGYYSKSDAAVVFQHHDRRSGRTRYLYHGNDGTNMPWNDTAQLDMLKHEVRQAVIEKIMEVARRFSIIRFDAAMTLAKKHFSRLWYPAHGTGGDIPSRADHAMSREQFDALFPVEFWREVVDKMNREMPETLLLAEAFWLMEGYFVRTLGMHRVYNSAFMHMLKNEENQKYKELITNTLRFDPAILKRYVNFMSNPDEETAIRQFGSGDKYFGVCLLMSTLPGLPMFAHGQIEGFAEKYGMEYQRAYYNENPDSELIKRHEREIFPLTARRYLFSEVEHFWLFDYLNDEGGINHNVFAFTNRHADERALVLYNNAYSRASGYISLSCLKLNQEEGAEKSLNLGQALGMQAEDNQWWIFREHISGLEYIKPAHAFFREGIHWALNGFEYRVFVDFRLVHDTKGEWAQLYRKLGGQGVANMDRRMSEWKLRESFDAFKSLFDGDVRERFEEAHENSLLMEGFLRQARFDMKLPGSSLQALNLFSERINALGRLMRWLYPAAGAAEPVHERDGFAAKAPEIPDTLNTGPFAPARLMVLDPRGSYLENSHLMMAWLSLSSFVRLFDETSASENADVASGSQPLDVRLNFDKSMLVYPLSDVLRRTGRRKEGIKRDIHLIRILLAFGDALYCFDNTCQAHSDQMQSQAEAESLMRQKARLASTMLEDEDVAAFIGLHHWEGHRYFSRESFIELNRWLLSLGMIELFGNQAESQEITLNHMLRFYRMACDMSEKAGYRLDQLLDSLGRL